MHPRVLLIDDDVSVHQAVAFHLRGKVDLTACLTADEALELVRPRQFDAALVDVDLGSGLSGTQLLFSFRKADPDLVAMIFTAHADMETMAASFDAHSFDFIPKNLSDDTILPRKLAAAVALTREQRARSQRSVDAIRLRSAVTDAAANAELEATGREIQAAVLNESLFSFSPLLGRIDLMEVTLKQHYEKVSSLAEAVKLSEETSAGLHDYIGRIRDHFAKPGHSVRSVNGVLAQAARMLRDETPGLGTFQRIDRGELKPDQPMMGDGLVLLGAIAIILRLLVKAAPEQAVFTLKPSMLFNPLLEVKALKARNYVRVLEAPESRKSKGPAVAIEIAGPGGGTTITEIAALFSETDGKNLGAPPCVAAALIAKLNGALIAEAKPGNTLRYRVFVNI